MLLQVGTDNDGIAMIGKFISEPYEADSWRKDGSRIHYADIQVFYACDLDEKKFFRASYFESKFPAIKWHGGHSGEKSFRTGQQPIDYQNRFRHEKYLWI